MLKDVLEKIIVKEKVNLKDKRRIYVLQLRYLPRKSYSSNTTVTPKKILKYVGNDLLILLGATLKKHLSEIYKGELVGKGNANEKNRNSDETNEDALEQQVDVSFRQFKI